MASDWSDKTIIGQHWHWYRLLFETTYLFNNLLSWWKATKVNSLSDDLTNYLVQSLIVSVPNLSNAQFSIDVIPLCPALFHHPSSVLPQLLVSSSTLEQLISKVCEIFSVYPTFFLLERKYTKLCSAHFIALFDATCQVYKVFNTF